MKPTKELDRPSLLNNSTLFAELNLLICDPDLTVAMLIRNILSTLGCNRIYIVHDGQDVLELMKDERIDIIVTEWTMKSLSGIDLTRFLRQSLDSPNRMVPIIMLTARNSRDDIQGARDAGMTEFIVKPFSAKTLLERVYAVVEKPRSFILAPSYTGPDRRRLTSMSLPPDPDDNRQFFERKPALVVSKDILQQLILDDIPRMIMPDYTLKQKIGFDIPEELIVNPLSLAKSEQEVQDVQDKFMQTMMHDLDTMQSSYELLVKGPQHARRLIGVIKEASFSIQSQAALFGYIRATEIAGQLYNFCKRYYENTNADHLIILDKHIKTIMAIFVGRITGDGGAVGKELVIDLARLIHRYMQKKG